MAGIGGPAHITAPVAPLAQGLPDWATLVRAPNPGPMTLDGTNTWYLRAPGSEAGLVVDPGPADEGHLAAVAALGPVAAILITHGHPDHVEGAERLSQLTGAPVQEECGGEPAGLRVERLATPGHTADSVSLVVAPAAGGERGLLSGDTILGRGTTVVAWPDGDLGDYLASLERLAGLGAIPVLPGHGPALADAGAAARYYLAHRRARLDQVRRAVLRGAGTPRQIVREVYRDIDKSLWRYAEWSAQAQLDYLRRESHRGAERLDQP
jgi:glyoxylase-like metal-dependent hydrolase (beta-lactamase superfamily II)